MKLENENLNEPQDPQLNIGAVMPSFSDWTKHLVSKMKQYPLVKNKWKESRFKKMYEDGLSVNEAFRCWFCAH